MKADTFMDSVSHIFATLAITTSTHDLQVGDGVFEVLATSGDTHLGGDDFDRRIVEWMADQFKANEGIDLRKDRQVRLPYFVLLDLSR